MAATVDQRRLLDRLDANAYLLGLEEDVQAVATRIANRGRTPDEGDDVKALLTVRGRLFEFRQRILSQHPDWQGSR